MFLKQSTAYTFRMGPFLDETDGKTAETGLTISQADVRLSKGGGNFAQKNESTSASHDEIGYYIVLLDATDTATVGELLVAVHESGALPVFKTFQVVEEAIYDGIYGGSADLITKVDAIDTVVDAILVDTGTTMPATIATVDTVVDAILVDTGTTLPATLDTIDNFLDTEVAAILADTNELQGDWANGGRLDLLLDATLADTAELQGDWANGGRLDLLLDAALADTAELQGDWVNGGRLDLLLDSVISKVDVVDGIVDDILVDTGTTLDGKLDTIDNFLDTEVAAILADTNELQGDWVNGGRLDLLIDSIISKVDAVDDLVDTEVAAIKTVVDAILVDTGTTLDTKINTIDTVVDSILVDTAEIGSAGAGLTAVPYNSAWDAEIQSECADALTAIGLDHIVSASVAGADVADDSIVAKLVSKESTADWDDFVNTTDSLQAVRDRGDAAWTTGGGGSAPTAAAVADAVWDEATSGHTTSGTFGEQVKTDIDAILVDTGTTLNDKIDVVDGIVDSILVDTGTTLNDKIDVIDGIVDSILVDTGTTLDGKLDTIDNFLDTEVAAILADTNELQTDWANGGRLDALLDSTIAKIDVVDGIVDNILVDTAVIGSAGAGLTAVPWNASWDAEVQSEVADALTAYDPPTKAEMDATWTTAQTESYASDGSTATPAQLLYMILCAVSEFSISSTTITGKKVDGSTTAMTWTLDDATSPTSRTRAS